MSKFKNVETGVVVSVADEKDQRFAIGWEPYEGERPEPVKPKRQSK